MNYPVDHNSTAPQSGKGRPLRDLIVLAVFAITYLAPIIVSFFLEGSASSKTYFLILTITLAASSIYTLSRGGITLVFYFQLLSFALFAYGLQQIIGATFVFGNQLSEISTTAFFVFFLHIVFCVIGFRITRQPIFRPPAKQTRKPNLLYVSAGCALVVVLAFVILGPVPYLSSRTEIYLLDNGANAGSSILEYWSKIVFFFAATASLGTSNKFKAPRLATWILIGIAIAIANPVNTPRYISITALMVFGMTLLLLSPIRRNIRLVVGLLPILLAVVQPLTSLMRSGLENLSFASAMGLYSTIEFSSFEVFLNTVRIYEGSSSLSNYSLSAIFIFIPRSIWPGKAEGIGVEVAEQSGFTFLNTALPSFANFYVDYGFIGIIIGSLIVGALLRRFDLPRITAFSFTNRRQMYSIILFALIPIFARGDFSSVAIAAYPMLFAYEYVRFLARLR